ncbi:MAG: ThuA domain-containing protein [Acidobacteria bacterium]|nr:ThuA domain-containing protein [Acidobacteriota bacterium]
MGYRLILLTALVSQALAQAPLRVLLVSTDPAPERRTAIARLRDTLEHTGRFSIRLSEDSPSSAASRYDALLLDCAAPSTNPGAWKAIVSFRAARCSNAAPPAAANELRIQWTNPQHPIAAGLAPQFRTSDAPGPLTTGDTLASSGSAPVVRLQTKGKTRHLETALGENNAVLQEPAFLDIIARSLEFTATGKVTLPPRDTSHRAPSSALRTLIVTGGHPYDTSFYNLFENNPKINAQIDPHPRPYRAGDLRPRHDVLVLYDSMQAIDEQERKTLTDFLESGKGVVFLHHSLVDYCNWQWWYEEVMGGRWYQTGDNPPKWKTRWKHDVEQIVRPVVPHPVTEGVGVMHIWDETYQGMWLSPKNQVLMRSDDPSSDGPVVWISPYQKSRVVVIELGHGRTAHEHPAYRRLVQNAIIWAGGK